MKKYEITFILSNQENVANQTREKIEALFSELKVTETHFFNLGIKNFFFPIKKNLKGRLVISYLECEADKINALDKRLRLEESILRFIIVTLENKEFDFIIQKNNKLYNPNPKTTTA